LQIRPASNTNPTHARPTSSTRSATGLGMEVPDLKIHPTRITRPTSLRI